MDRVGLVGPVSVKLLGGVLCLSAPWYFVYWYLKNRLEAGPVTADLATTVVYSYKSARNDVKPVNSHVSHFSI